MAQDRGSDRRFLPFAPHPCHKCQIFIGCWLQVLPGVWHCSSIFSWKKSQHHASLVDTDWYRLLNFGVLKKNLKSTQFVELYFGVSGGRVQVWVRVRAPAGNLAIVPEGYSRIQSKFLTANSMAKLLGLRSSTDWAVGRSSTNTGSFLFGGSRCGLRPTRLR